MAGFYRLQLDEEGTTSLRFTYAVDGVGVDLSGWSAQATGRRGPNASTTEFDLTTSGGDISVDSSGNIDCTWTDEITDAINNKHGNWELVVTNPSGARYSLLKGPFALGPKVVA